MISEEDIQRCAEKLPNPFWDSVPRDSAAIWGARALWKDGMWNIPRGQHHSCGTTKNMKTLSFELEKSLWVVLSYARELYRTGHLGWGQEHPYVLFDCNRLCIRAKARGDYLYMIAILKPKRTD